ncbi:MAG: YkgJ family cysteine cluster protein [Candidatus Sericytochromatia bacterium]
MNPVELYEALDPSAQQRLDEINFLAAELRDHLLPEQFLLATEALTARLQQIHPSIACPRGCSHCCESYALPEVTPAEWELIKLALDNLPPPIQQQLQKQIAEAQHTFPLEVPRNQQPQARCPLLLDGQCSVYGLRPLDCRLTGYSFSQAGERPLPGLRGAQPSALPYSCTQEQQRMLHELHQGLHPLEYMFMPQRERLLASFAQLQPHPAPSQRLLSYLAHWQAHT